MNPEGPDDPAKGLVHGPMVPPQREASLNRNSAGSFVLDDSTLTIRRVWIAPLHCQCRSAVARLPYGVIRANPRVLRIINLRTIICGSSRGQLITGNWHALLE